MAVQGECAAQRRVSEAEADMDIRNWEQRNYDTALDETSEGKIGAGLMRVENEKQTGGIYSHNGVMDYPRYPISEMHLGKFPDSLEFQSWRVVRLKFG